MGLLQAQRRKASGALGFRGQRSKGGSGSPPGREAVLGHRITHSSRPSWKYFKRASPGPFLLIGWGRQEQEAAGKRLICIHRAYPQTPDLIFNCQLVVSRGSQKQDLPSIPQLRRLSASLLDDSQPHPPSTQSPKPEIRGGPLCCLAPPPPLSRLPRAVTSTFHPQLLPRGLCHPSLALDCCAGPLTHSCIPSFPNHNTATKSRNRSKCKINGVLISHDKT